MRVIIAGCRHITGKEADQLVRDVLNASGWKDEITEVLHGNAPGVDLAANRVCQGTWPIRKFPADWGKYGKRAGPIRNKEMAKNADAIIAIWDGRSKGTANMIATATTFGLKIHVHKIRRIRSD